MRAQSAVALYSRHQCGTTGTPTTLPTKATPRPCLRIDPASAGAVGPLVHLLEAGAAGGAVADAGILDERRLGCHHQAAVGGHQDVGVGGHGEGLLQLIEHVVVVGAQLAAGGRERGEGRGQVG